jgi:hypothetical protein
VPILDIRRAEDDSIKAIVFGYACHNTTMNPQDRLYSSDWAGQAARRLEEWHPNSTALFITGCAADQNPDPRGTQELSMQYGNDLAAAVERVLDGPGVEIEGRLRVGYEAVDLEMVAVTREGLMGDLGSDDLPKRAKARYLLERLDRGETLETFYPAPLQVVMLGDELLMILMSSETVIDWSHKFKEDFAGDAGMIWVAGYCNDMYGYVPTLQVQREGGYEGGRANLWSWLPSPWTEIVEKTVIDATRHIVKRVTNSK